MPCAPGPFPHKGRPTWEYATCSIYLQFQSTSSDQILAKNSLLLQENAVLIPMFMENHHHPPATHYHRWYIKAFPMALPPPTSYLWDVWGVPSMPQRTHQGCGCVSKNQNGLKTIKIHQHALVFQQHMNRFVWRKGGGQSFEAFCGGHECSNKILCL